MNRQIGRQADRHQCSIQPGQALLCSCRLLPAREKVGGATRLHRAVWDPAPAISLTTGMGERGRERERGQERGREGAERAAPVWEEEAGD